MENGKAFFGVYFSFIDEQAQVQAVYLHKRSSLLSDAHGAPCRSTKMNKHIAFNAGNVLEKLNTKHVAV